MQQLREGGGSSRSGADPAELEQLRARVQELESTLEQERANHEEKVQELTAALTETTECIQGMEAALLDAQNEVAAAQQEAENYRQQIPQ